MNKFLFQLSCIGVNMFLQNNNEVHILCLEHNFLYNMDFKKLEELNALETCEVITLFTDLVNI